MKTWSPRLALALFLLFLVVDPPVTIVGWVLAVILAGLLAGSALNVFSIRKEE